MWTNRDEAAPRRPAAQLVANRAHFLLVSEVGRWVMVVVVIEGGGVKGYIWT